MWGIRHRGLGVWCLGAGFWVLGIGNAGAQQPMSFSKPAPELVGGAWINTPKGKPIRLADRKGKVTVVEFWTFG